MDSDRWTSKWQPADASSRGPASTHGPTGRNAHLRDDDYGWSRGGTGNASSRPQPASASRWERRGGFSGADQHGADHFRNRPQSWKNQNSGPPRSQHQPSRGRHHAADGHAWGSQDAVQGLESDIMGETFGGVDPVEDAPASISGGWTSGFGADGPASYSGPGGSSATRLGPPGGPVGVTLAELEEAMASGELRGWSLERLAEATTKLCQLWPPDSAEMDPSKASAPLSRQDEAVMDALATAAVGAHCLPQAASCPPTSQRAWAAAQLLWACARGQYWSGPPPPPAQPPPPSSPGSVRGARGPTVTEEAKAADGPGRGEPQEGGDSGGNKAWPRPTEAQAAGAPPASVPAAAATAGKEGAPAPSVAPPAGSWAAIAAGYSADGGGRNGRDAAVDAAGAGAAAVGLQGLGLDDAPRAYSRRSCWGTRDSDTPAPAPAATTTTTAAAATAAASETNPSASDATSEAEAPDPADPGPSWCPLAVGMLNLLSADGCRLAGQLDSRSVSLVWWALAKASAVARVRHMTPTAAAAGAVLAAASPALTSVLDARAAESLGLAGGSQLCSLLYSCAAANRGAEQLVARLCDELASRLEEGVFLGGGGQRGRFTARELSCVAYSCGLLGLRHERLLTALAEYATSSSHIKWGASAISVFMYGISNVGFRDARLMDWAEAVITATPPAQFNLRNISFLLYNFHRLRWWPRSAADHLLAAAGLHPPASIPVISISTILMCMGSGRGRDDRGRDDRALAHLCMALAAQPRSRMSPKDVCICLTALQRMHGEDILASQQPEVLAALDHLVATIVERGFSRPGPEPGSPPVPVFNHQEVSNAMFALGKLKYYSPQVLQALRDHAARGGLEGASAWDCTATLVGLAQLNYDIWEDVDGGAGAGGVWQAVEHSRPQAAGWGRSPVGAPGGGPAGRVDLVGMLANVVAQRARNAKSQDLANTLWALCTLEGALIRYRSIVETLVEEVNRRGPTSHNPDGFNVDEQRQLWQVHRELAAVPEPYASLREDLVRLGRLGMSEADHTYSRVQASFQSVLVAMHRDGRFPELRDLLFEQELVPGGEQLIRIDVQAIIDRPNADGGTSPARVAVEFDGPFHFMINEPYTKRIDGRTALRNRILTRYLGAGNLVCVSMAEWVAASREPTRGMPGRWRLLATKMGLRC